MSTRFVCVQPEFATISLPGPSSGIEATAVLPNNGFVSIDPLRPYIPISVWVGRDHLESDDVRLVVQALSETTPAVLSSTLPDTWTRLAVVNAVDRWFADSLDAIDPGREPRTFGELILAVDRALALHGVGDEDAARAILSDAVQAAANQVSADPSLPVSMRDALNDAAETLNLSVLDGLAWTLGGDQLLARGGNLSDYNDQFTLITRSIPDMPAGGLVDPTHVAARVLRPEIIVERVPNSLAIRVTGWAFPDVTPSSGWANRLLLRLVRQSDLATITTVPFTMVSSSDGDEFQAEVPLGDGAFDDVAIDVFDRHAICEPRDAESIRLSVACQRAYTQGRRALANAAIDEIATAQRHFADALSALDGLAGDSIDTYREDLRLASAALKQGRLDISSPAVYRTDGPTRPTLAELYLAYNESSN